MNLLTFVTPIAPYHRHLVDNVIKTVKDQTVPCEHILIYDNESLGAGWARNRGLESVKTDFVSFLDCDDEIDPQFAEKLLKAYEPGHYTYCDWYMGNTIQGTDEPWTLKGDWHVITCVLPTSAIRAINGFDEALQATEDTWLFWALTRAGICGIRVPEPLFTYGAGGKRAKSFIGTPEHLQAMQALIERYKDMGCCGDSGPVQFAQQSETLQDGYVWAQALWGGNCQQRGKVSGLLYPRTGNGKVIQVDKRDVQAAPQLWREVQTLPSIITPPKPDMTSLTVLGANGQAIDHRSVRMPGVRPVAAVAPEANGLREIAANLWPQREAPHVGETVEEQLEVKPAVVKPNVSKARKLAGRGNSGKKAG